MGISKTKRLLALFTSVMLLTLVACNNSSGSSDPDKEDEKPDTTTTTPSNTPTPIPDGGSSVDDPIKFNVVIPAHKQYTQIERQEVTADKKAVSDWYAVGWTWHDTSDPEYSDGETFEYKDVYGLVKDKYYAYRIIFDNNYSSSAVYKYFKAGYDGLKEPEFETTGHSYPEIEWHQESVNCLVLQNKDQISFKFYNNENTENLYWNMNLSYDWRVWPSFDSSKEIWNEPLWGENSTYDLSYNPHDTFDTGKNTLTSLSVGLWFYGDKYAHSFYVPVDSINGNKIPKEVWKTPEQITEDGHPHNKWVYSKFHWPKEAEGKEITEINFQRRERSNTSWPQDLNKDRVGYLNGADIEARTKEGVFEFYDKYAIKTDKEYETRVLFIYKDENGQEHTGELPLGITSTQIATEGIPDIDPSNPPEFTWDGNAGTLKWIKYTDFLSNNKDPMGALPIKSSTQRISIFVLYVNTWGDGFFWPTFSLNLGDNSGVFTIPLQGNSDLPENYKLEPKVANLRFYEEGECIAQSIEFDESWVTDDSMTKGSNPRI